MADICGIPFGACLVRVTRLYADGNVIPGANSYTTSSPISVAIAPNIETGNNISVRNGCGCKIGSRRFPDTLNYWDITLTMAQFEPTLFAFMTGAALIADGGSDVGIAFPTGLDCDEQAPRVAFEWWAENGSGSGLNATHPYFHGVFPSSTWQWGDNTFEEGNATPTLVGVTQSNSNWGEGPYGDGPPDAEDISEGGIWATNDALPSAECEAQNVTAVS